MDANYIHEKVALQHYAFSLEIEMARCSRLHFQVCAPYFPPAVMG